MSDAFLEHRGLLFTVAYEMLGSAADAEDVLQESWIRWDAVDQGAVREPRAYLVRLVTRQALNRLRSLKRRREEYVGPWLPEPVATAPDVLDDVELAESVSFAMMLVLETLGPLERAVFVLHDVFGFPHDEIAAATGRTSTAVRQTASRARKHVEARRPRMQAPADAQEVTARFLEATGTGELQPLMDLLAPDVVLLSDGGGKKKAALRPLHGARNVARWLLGVLQKESNSRFDYEWSTVNGQVSVLIHLDGELDSVATVTTEGGRIREIYMVRNPDKLRWIDKVQEVRR